ncbi:MAG: hypothetical protein IKM31_07550 [Oscillospiraceae bacterium]|nr:hypothetical protein [Oscillospiraceae bacterium]
MQINTARPVSPIRTPEFLTACLWGIFLSGVLIGAGRGGEELSALTGQFLELRRGSGWRTAFASSLLSSAGMLTVIFAGGFSAVGQPVVLAVLLVRGMGLGGCVGQLYQSMSFGSALAAVFLLVLPEVFASFCLLQGGRSAFRMSGRLFRAMVSGEPQPLSSGTKRYAVRFVILFLLLIFSAALSGCCAGIFGLLSG